MKMIHSLEEFREITAMEKGKCEEILTNIPVLQKTVGTDIEKNRVSWVEQAGGALFLTDEGRYYKIYYIWDGKKSQDRLKLNKPVVIEEIDFQDRRLSYLNNLRGHLDDAGFTLYRENLQVEKNLWIPADDESGIAKGMNTAGSADEIHFKRCTPELMKQVEMLWRDSLDVFDVPGDHWSLSENAEVICACNAKGDVAGCQWWSHSAGRSEGRHTVTRHDYRKRGIASSLIEQWCESAKKANAGICMTWIASTNTPSLNLYSKMGFRLNGRICRQYTLKQAETEAI